MEWLFPAAMRLMGDADFRLRFFGVFTSLTELLNPSLVLSFDPHMNKSPPSVVMKKNKIKEGRR